MSFRARGLAALITLGASVTPAAAAPTSVVEARRLVAEVRYEEARRMLEKLQAIEGHPLSTTLELLELQGVVAGALKQPDKARMAFKKLLSLKPDAHLSADLAPRISTPFFEAKGWLTSHAPLSFTARPATLEEGRITGVGVVLKDDQLSLARKIRLFARVGDGPIEQLEQPAAAQVSMAVSGTDVAWWGELIGERDAIIAEVGSGASPILETARLEVVKGPSGPPMVKAPPSPSAPLRIAAVVSASLGVIGLGTGAVFGVRSSQARAQFDRATGAMQLVTSLTRAQAVKLDADARSQALTANVMFITGAALVITGVVLWLLGEPAAERAP